MYTDISSVYIYMHNYMQIILALTLYQVYMLINIIQY